MTTPRKISGFTVVAFILILTWRFPVGAQSPSSSSSASTASTAATQAHAAPQSQSSGAANYVGSDTCKGCHEELFNKFSPTPHAHLLPEKTNSGGIEAHGCESCHGPGSAHVDGGGDKTKIINFYDRTPKQISETCQTCHRDGERSNFHRSSHLTNGVGCTSCHSVHAAKVKQALLRDQPPSLCYTCHTEARAEFSRPYRHRVNEGLVQCMDCHNEHGGFLPKQLRTSASQDQVCYKCHAEKRGPFVYIHVPVKAEGCVACHTPHGSTNPRLLKVYPTNILCLQCHTLSLGNIPSQPPVGPAHNQSQKYQACTMCHAFIHGSNVSEVFFKP
jgi:DmsE family decaheme c-type cytochrome